VRHHFKIGYFLEATKDVAGAVKYYRSSFAFLKSLAPSPESVYCTEAKAVAYIVTFRLCRLLVQLGRSQEALEQVRVSSACAGETGARVGAREREKEDLT
jgi:hypothetical protein